MNLKKNDKIKISNFGTFSIRLKKSRLGRNPKTKVEKIISERKVLLFKPSTNDNLSSSVLKGGESFKKVLKSPISF